MGSHIFQSTLPQRERRISSPGMGNRSKISIHTPTKGATPDANTVYCLPEISIHTPTKGATYNAKTMLGIDQFQSTLPQRERQIPGFR